MGFKIGKLLEKSKTKTSIESLRGKIIAVDAMGFFYQFISVAVKIKKSGNSTTDRSVGQGVAGFLLRNTHFIRNGIQPIYAIEGGTRSFLEKEKDEELKSVFRRVMKGCIRIVELLGFPIIHTVTEGEAQASYIVNNGDADSCASQDYDCLLFGCKKIVMNLGASRNNIFTIKLDSALEELGITREQLVDVSMLVGSDFSKGVKGIGSKTAIDLIKKHKSIEDLNEARVKVRGKIAYVPPEDIEFVRSIFLNPDVNTEYPEPKWSVPNFSILRKDLLGKYGCNSRIIDVAIHKLKKIDIGKKQNKIDSWFS